MHDFDLHRPTTLQEAQIFLGQHGEEARIIAGGTGLVQLMKLRLSQPEHLVALHRVPGLAGIERGNGALRIGAMTAHREKRDTASGCDVQDWDENPLKII